MAFNNNNRYTPAQGIERVSKHLTRAPVNFLLERFFLKLPLTSTEDKELTFPVCNCASCESRHSQYVIGYYAPFDELLGVTLVAVCSKCGFIQFPKVTKIIIDSLENGGKGGKNAVPSTTVKEYIRTLD